MKTGEVRGAWRYTVKVQHINSFRASRGENTETLWGLGYNRLVQRHILNDKVEREHGGERERVVVREREREREKIDRERETTSSPT